MLRVTLHINAEQIADYEIRNLGETSPGEARYSIRPIIDGTRTGDVIAHVHHYRAQGAESLASKAMEAAGRANRRAESRDGADEGGQG